MVCADDEAEAKARCAILNIRGGRHISASAIVLSSFLLPSHAMRFSHLGKSCTRSHSHSHDHCVFLPLLISSLSIPTSFLLSPFPLTICHSGKAQWHAPTKESLFSLASALQPQSFCFNSYRPLPLCASFRISPSCIMYWQFIL